MRPSVQARADILPVKEPPRLKVFRIPIDTRLHQEMMKHKLFRGETFTVMVRNALAQYLGKDPEAYLGATKNQHPRKRRHEAKHMMPVVVGERTLQARRSDGLIPLTPEDCPIKADSRYLFPRLTLVTLLCTTCGAPFEVRTSKNGRVRQTHCAAHVTYPKK